MRTVTVTPEEADLLGAVWMDQELDEEAAFSLRRAILGELTQCQRECLDAYCVQGKKLELIARERGVCPSTVWRHIQAAKKKVRRQLQYHYNYKLYF